MAERERNGFEIHFSVKERVDVNLGSLRAAVCRAARHRPRDRGLGTVIRAGKPKRLPFVMTHAEVKAVINLLDGGKRIMASLMCGVGCRKSPNALAHWYRKWVVPQENLWKTTKTCEEGCRHVYETTLQRAVKEAVRKAGTIKRIECHTFRNSFAVHLLETGYDIRTIQELLDHKDVSTTMICTHVLNRGGHGVRSLIDRI
jgi:integrase